jgi:Bax protein
MVPNRREGGAIHEVRSFNTIAESVEAYLFNLNTSSFYENFRFSRGEMRATGRELNSFELAYHLNSYSERGESYIDEIQTLIEQNLLTRRD